EDVDLARGQRPPQRLGWHPLGLILSGDPPVELAGLEVARHDGAGARLVRPEGPLLGVEPQTGLAVPGVGAMALEALVRQDRPDLEVEVDSLGGLDARYHGRMREDPGPQSQTTQHDHEPGMIVTARPARDRAPRRQLGVGRLAHHHISPGLAVRAMLEGPSRCSTTIILRRTRPPKDRRRPSWTGAAVPSCRPGVLLHLVDCRGDPRT